MKLGISSENLQDPLQDKGGGKKDQNPFLAKRFSFIPIFSPLSCKFWKSKGGEFAKSKFWTPLLLKMGINLQDKEG
jgi:hypothetical protein